MDSKAVSGGTMGELFLGPRLSPPAPPLIEEHEEEARQAKGAGDRANSAAAVDTAGASMGSEIA
jgi:hypothetical protein